MTFNPAITFNPDQLIAIGTYGFAFNTSNPDVVKKVIPIGKQSEKVILDEYTIHQQLSDISCNVHVYNYKNNAMVLSNETICPKIITKLESAPINDMVKRILDQSLTRQKLPMRDFGSKFFQYRLEKLTNILYKIKDNYKLVYIIVYQIIEMYECLVRQAPFNFGHHDLHPSNVGYIEHDGNICAKIFDFGFACFENKEINIELDHHLGKKYSAYQHAVLDVMHLLSALYVYGGDSIIGKIVCGRECLGVCKYRSSYNLFNDFYGIKMDTVGGRYSYLASQVCKLQDTVDLAKIKKTLKQVLQQQFAVTWSDETAMIVYPHPVSYDIYKDVTESTVTESTVAESTVVESKPIESKSKKMTVVKGKFVKGTGRPRRASV